MENIENTKEIILTHERKYAAKLGGHVMNKPKLSSLMVFIPFLFIFFIQDLLKYKQGRRKFTSSYLLSREKALHEAFEVHKNNRKIDTSAIAEKAGLKKSATKTYADFLEILTTHYLSLLKGKGDDYEILVKSAYNNSKKNFRNFTNRLSQAEILLNKSLSTDINKEQEGVTSIIKKIESGNSKLRLNEINQIFG